jgi:hypothetical protein
MRMYYCELHFRACHTRTTAVNNYLIGKVRHDGTIGRYTYICFKIEAKQGQISKILFPAYDYLDTNDRKDRHLTIQKHSKSDSPDLEAALFEWHQKMLKQKATITSDILKSKAHEF